MDIKAADLLRTYSAQSVQQMARKRGVQVKGSAKEPIVAALSRVLYEPESIDRALEDLAPNERRLVDLLVMTGGEAPTGLIMTLMEQEGLIDKQTRENQYAFYYHQPTGTIHTKGSRKFEDVVARVSALCLVFTTEHLSGYGSTYEHGKPGRRLFIPDGILRHLPKITLSVKTIPAPPVIREADPGLLLRDFYLLLSFASREPIPLTARGPIVKKTLIKINQALRNSEDLSDVRSEDELGWIPLLRALAQELGVLGQSVGELVLDSRAGDYLRLPANERRKRLFDAYRKTAHFFEIFRIPDLPVKGKTVSLRAAPPGAIAARRRILTELLDLPTGEWIDFSHLIDRIRTRAYEFLLPRRGRGYYYSSSSGYAYESYPYASDNPLGVTFEMYRNERETWDDVEGNVIWVVVSEVLYALGVVDLGGDDKNITAFRITEDGARLLRDEPLPMTETTPQVVVQPNFQIFAFEPTGEDVLFTLDQIADRVSSQQAIEYELTRDSVYRAQRAGLDAATIIAFLESVSTVALPQNVRRSLEEWGGQLERITLRRRTPLLQTPDVSTLDALYADPEIAPLLGRRLAPTAALVATTDLRPLSDRLIAAGRLPALTEGPDNQPPRAPRLSVTTDGAIEFRQRLPSLFDLKLLRPFAAERNGDLHLTPESLRRAARAKLTADEMIATLERLQASPLLPEVAAFIRRWAKDWGRGALVEAVILQVEQPETLADLLADPEIKPHLQAVPSAPTLALVKPESVKRVRDLLNARGMALGDRLLR